MSTESNAAKPAVPPVEDGLVPYLNLRDANAASLFYQRAFGAEEVARMPAETGDGRLMHCHVRINGHALMFNDPMPEHGYPLQIPAGYTLTLMVDDIDAWFARAVEAGAEVAMPISTMFWGDRYGQLVDPFGVRWAMNETAKR